MSRNTRKTRKSANIIKRCLKKIKRRLSRTRKQQKGGSETAEKPSILDGKTQGVIQEVVTSVMKGVKEADKAEKKEEAAKVPEPPRGTYFSHRPTGIVEQILLAPLRIPAKILKFPFKLYKFPLKFVKRMVF
jgi:hypothetical protein